MSELARASDVVLILDVLSFTTAVEVAVSRGATVLPFPLKDHSAAEYAGGMNADLAATREQGGYSLSPASLQSIPAGYRLVLPSPNGAAVSFACEHPTVLAACLRNASAVAAAAARLGSTFAVIPAGETWDTGELRPAAEDLIGAGAVIAALPGSRSPEAQSAVCAFENFRHDLLGALRRCSSGKELIERGFEGELELAAQLNVSNTVPRLVDRAYVAFRETPCGV